MSASGRHWCAGRWPICRAGRVRQLNLGFGATGSDYVAMMVHQSIDTLTPDAVCVLWPSAARITWFPTPRRQVFFLPEWQPGIDTAEHSAFLRLATDAQGFFNFVRNFQLVRARLAECGIPYYWGTLGPAVARGTAACTGRDGYVGAWQPMDLARDGRHAGIGTHAAFAASVVEAMARPGSQGAGARHIAPTRSSMTAPDPDQPAATARAVTLRRPVDRVLSTVRVRRRIRAMKRRDPFIY